MMTLSKNSFRKITGGVSCAGQGNRQGGWVDCAKTFTGNKHWQLEVNAGHDTYTHGNRGAAAIRFKFN